ncbi:hypothetical protein MHUMG1_09328 [Metarhizium humberi]|uniref:Uncharacterized protein n=1 Tax=Metarhizium humberi TaxID=2596975 RepID=A0A9P8M2L3_9HYPO|nr:hypothetical protein MHUMG1_09328 [Metarhizium humberi]
MEHQTQKHSSSAPDKDSKPPRLPQHLSPHKNRLYLDHQFAAANLAVSHPVQPRIDAVQPILDVDNIRRQQQALVQQSRRPGHERAANTLDLVKQLDGHRVQHDVVALGALWQPREPHEVAAPPLRPTRRARRRHQGRAAASPSIARRLPQRLEQMRRRLAAAGVEAKPQPATRRGAEDVNGARRVVAVDQQVRADDIVPGQPAAVLGAVHDHGYPQPDEPRELDREVCRSRRT